MPYEHELEVALEAARDAGAVLLRHYETGSETWEKSKDNPVTAADLESDRVIAKHLTNAFPEDALLSEETVADPARTEKRRIWIVDPMDGTKEFTRRIPEFAVSIALVEAGEPVVAVILNPVTNVAVWASRGGGCFRGASCGAGDPVRVSSCPKLSDAVMIASRTEISREKFEPHRSWFRELRPVGSIAWKLACVACGDGDLNVSLAPKNEWDVCAGDLLVTEAGGVYVDFDGERRRYNQPDPLIRSYMAAGPAVLVDAFCDLERERTG